MNERKFKSTLKSQQAHNEIENIGKPVKSIILQSTKQESTIHVQPNTSPLLAAYFENNFEQNFDFL